jgi:hypothetical protein
MDIAPMRHFFVCQKSYVTKNLHIANTSVIIEVLRRKKAKIVQDYKKIIFFEKVSCILLTS